jgi:hypothetical protein
VHDSNWQRMSKVVAPAVHLLFSPLRLPSGAHLQISFHCAPGEF